MLIIKKASRLKRVFIPSLLLFFMPSCLLVKSIKYSLQAKTTNKVRYKKQDAYSIPFSIQGGYMTVNASVKGKKGNFIFDTGAFGLIDSVFAEEITHKKEFAVFKGDYRVDTTDFIGLCFRTYSALKLGDMLIRKPKMGLCYLDVMSPEIYCHVDGGLLGLNYFKDNYVKLDFTRQQLLINKDIDGLMSTDYSMFPNVTKNIQSSQIIQIKVNGEPYKFILDTGFPEGILLFEKSLNSKEKLAESDYIIKGVPYKIGDGSFGDNFPEITYLDTNATISLGATTFSYPVQVLKNGQSKGLDYDGMLGRRFLQELNPVFDLKENQVYFNVNDETIQALSQQTISVPDYQIKIKEKQLYLSNIKSELFHQLPIKALDDLIITQINNKVAQELLSESCNDKLSSWLSSTSDSLTLVMKSGVKLELKNIYKTVY